jgi:glycolate oxidase
MQGLCFLIELDGNSKEEIEKHYESIGKVCMDKGAIEVYIADNATTSERIWKIRRNVAEAWKLVSPHQSLEDVVVPVSEIPEFVRGLEKLSQKYDVPIPCYGHAGDGNLHCTPVMNPKFTLQQWHKVLPELLKEMYILTAELGGTISGEHGIGSKRKDYMKLVMEEEQIEVMRKIKKALDPNLILNPGKLFNM